MFYKDIKELKRVFDCVFSPFYFRRPSLWGKKMKHIDNRISISKRWDFIYIRIPKCANSTVSVNIDFYLPEKGKKRKKRYAEVAKNRFESPRQMSFKDVHDINKKYYKFTIVRDPHERLLSAYLDKFRKRGFKDRFGEGIKKHGQNINFESFCKWIANGGYSKDPHWIPQQWYIDVIGEENLDYIGCVESLGNDLKNILATIGVNDEIDILEPKFEQYDRDYHTTSSSSKIDKYYDSETYEIVKNTYSNDIEAIKNYSCK